MSIVSQCGIPCEEGGKGDAGRDQKSLRQHLRTNLVSAVRCLE